MKRMYFIFIAALILSAIITPVPASQAANKLNVSIHFNKPVYEPSDKMSVKGAVKPSSDISDVRASLKIGPKDDYAYTRTVFLGNLKKGQKQTFEFNKDSAQNFGLEAGSNPLLLEITSQQKPVYEFSTKLGLINSDVKEKMNLALAVNLASRPHIDINKKITNVAAVKKLLPRVQEYQNLCLQNKGLINLIFSPLLAETLKKSSPETLDNFNKLFVQNKAQIISTTYSQMESSRISERSLADQSEEGRKVLESIFSKKIGLSRFEANANRTLSIKGPGRTLYLPLTQGLLKGKNKPAATIGAFAVLSEFYNNNKKEVVLTTANVAPAQNVAFFIQAAKKESWLTLKPLTDLEPLGKLKPKSSVKRPDSVLAKARNKYFVLKSALAAENAAFSQAKMAIYLAEDRNNNIVDSRKLAIKAFNLLDGEIKKVAFKLSPLTLTGREGKLPIKIINNTGSKLKAYLVIKTEGLESKKQTKPYLIAPKENLLSLPVKVLKSGRHKVLVQLKTDGLVITQEDFLVSTNLPSTFWLYSAGALAFLLLLIIGAFYVRERRSKIARNS